MGKHTELYDHKTVTSGFHVEEMLSKVNTHRSPFSFLFWPELCFSMSFVGKTSCFWSFLMERDCSDCTNVIAAHTIGWNSFSYFYSFGHFWWRAHNSSPNKWYCHFWDWHNWYLTLLIKSKLILVNFGTLNYWYWAQFTLTLLKFDISDLQNDWHLQLLIFGIIGISCFWFLELFIFSMSDIKHDWYGTWLT